MSNKLLVLAFAVLITAGCSNHQALPSQSGGTGTQGLSPIKPHVRQTGENPIQWRRFNWGSVQAPYYPTIAAASDGNMWYTDYSGLQLVRMNMQGSTKRFPLTSYNPTSMAVGSDNKFYLGDINLATIEVVTQSGVETKVATPSTDKIGYAGSMTLGPDGNVWFTEYSHVGKITPGDVVTEYLYSDATTNNYLGSITTGPDGNLWATEYFNSQVDKITPGTGAMTTFALGCNPTQITSAGGMLYINCGSNIAQVTTAGAVTLFFNGFGFSGSGKAMTVGPDGNPWFCTGTQSTIGEFNVSSGSMSFFLPPNNFGSSTTCNSLTAGPDGNIWAVDSSARSINVYILNVIGVSPTTLTFTGTGQNQTITVTEPGTSAWTATSSNTGVATVAQGSPASHFTVTSVAAGTCKIIVTDAIGNSFAVHVTVQ
jgi:streptogramin lyase